MYKRLRYILFFLIIAGCVEPYNFRITDNEPTLVVEAFVSDKSFNETLTYPSDGRYFTVKLSWTGDVINIRAVLVSGAYVRLVSDSNEEWQYLEISNSPGIYELPDKDFKAEPGKQYKLVITVPGDDDYESDWEKLPSTVAPPMGSITFEETSILKKQPGGLTPLLGVVPKLSVTVNNTGETLYYRWKLDPTWIYVAPLAATQGGPSNGRTCWATSPYYLNNFVLQEDHGGGYDKELFFMDVEQNERVLEEFSLLAVQHTLSENNYYFWKEMQGLNQEGSIFDTPPFNLKTNFSSASGKKVSGYFGVVGEQATRWYFNIRDLSYGIDNWLIPACSLPCGPGCPPPNCTSCLRYEGGTPTNVKPVWWGR